MNQENKPETVEQAADKYCDNAERLLKSLSDEINPYHAFIAGANWQASQHNYTEKPEMKTAKQILDEVELWADEPILAAMEKYANQFKEQSYTEQKWVSVKDRLPEYGEDFNVVLDLEDGGEPVSGIMEFDGVKFIWIYPGSDVECVQVTHWQPTPSPLTSNQPTPPTYIQEQMIAFGEAVKQKCAGESRVIYIHNAIKAIDISKLLKK